MYLPNSQIQENLNSNGDLVYKNTSTPYYGKYFLTSKGKYYANSPNDIVLIELEIPIEEDGKVLDTDNPNSELSGDLRFDGLDNLLYSYLIDASQKPPIFSSPPYHVYVPSNTDKSQGYSIRYFAKKNTANEYIEISSNTYKLFQNNDSTVAITLYEVKNLIWYLQSPSDKPLNEVNLANLLDFEKKNNWINFHHYIQFSSSKEEYFYTKGNELLLPNRTSYVGYYHFMPEGGIMTGKFHGDGNEILLIPLPNFSPSTDPPETEEQLNVSTLTNTQTSTSPSYSPPASSGGGGGGY